MSQPPNDPQSPPKPKITAEERRARKADQLTAVRLRVAITRKMDEQCITDPYAIALAFGMPMREAMKLLNRHEWREGDVIRLQALAARLGLPHR